MTSIPSETTSGGNTDQWDRQRLREILSADDSSAREQIQQVLQLGAERFDVELGLLVHVDAAERTYTIDEASAPHPNITRGRPADLLFTYCQRVATEQKPLAIKKAPEQGWAMDLADPSSQLSTYVGTAVHVRNDTYGAVCFVDLAPRESAFDEKDRSFLVDLAQAIERLLERREPPEPSPSNRLPQELSGENQQYHTALKHAPVLFAKIDEELCYEWRLNPQSDLDPRDVAGKRDDELDSGPGIDQLMDLKRRALNRGEQMREEIVFEEPDGLTVYDVTATPLREGEGTNVTGLITAALNVTERKEKERRLEASEARYRTLAEHFPNGAVGVYDRDLRYSLVEGSLVGDVLPSASEFKNRRVTDIFPEETANDIVPIFRAALEEGTLGHVETQFGGRDWSVWATPLRDTNGEIFAGLSFAQDVTEQKRRENELRRQRNLLNQAQRLAGAWEVDLRTETVNWSESLYEIHEVPPDTEITLDDALDFFHEEDRAELERAFERCVEEGDPYDLEFRLLTAKGNERWVRTVGAPAERDHGTVVKVAGAFQDITDRKEAERRRKQVIRRVTDAIVEVDADWRFTLVNDQAEALFDMKEEALLGKDLWDVFSTALGTRFEETYRQVMQTREPASLVEYYSDLDGWFDVKVYPNEDGGVAFYFQEVTEQKQQETRLRDLSNSIPGVVFQFCVQPDGTYGLNFVSEHAEDVLGLSPEPETFFERYLKRIPDSHRDAFQASVDAAVAENEPWEFESPFITPSGERRWILGRSIPRENDGELVYNGVLLDITDRKEGERRLDAVFNHTYQFTGLMEPDGTLIEANDTALEFGGVTEADVLGKPLWDAYWFQTDTVDQEQLRNAVQHAAKGTFVRYEMEVQGRDETRIIDFSLRPVENEQGEITLLVPEGRDITERKEAEEALKQSRERLSMALEGGNIGTWDWDVKTGELIFNRQWAEMLGYSRDELDFHFSTWEELVHPEDLSRAMEVLTEYIEGKRDTYAPKIRMQTKSGDWKWIQTIGKVVDRDEHGEVTRAAGIHLDIHDRKKAEIALQRSERRFRKIFENAAIGIVIGDEEGYLQRANPAFQEMVGYEEDELRGRHFSYITHPDDDEGQALLKELDEGKRDRFQIEKRYIRKDGESFWGRLTISLLQLDSEKKHVALVEDIDEQKRYEAALREAKNEAEDAAQLKSVMLANMSHEVRTPLTSMIGFSSILESQLEDGRPAKIARLIHKSGQRLEDTMDAVLQLSQLEAGSYTLDRESLRIDTLAKSFTDRFSPQAEERRVTVTVSTEPVEAYVDETALWHVFSNLLDNALKFTPEDGQVTVRTRADGPKTAILEVEDTGVGISEGALPTVFEAFKQESEGLTREYEGAGLGLAIVQRLVEALGGQISIDTAKEEGTCVTVRLPRTSGDPSSDPQ